MIAKIKQYALAIGGAIIGVLYLLLRIVGMQRNKARREAEAYKAQVKQREAEMKSDNEVDQEFSHRAEEARKDLDEGTVPRILRDPNK